MRIFWGETHDNTYQFMKQNAGASPSYIERALSAAKEHLDFYAAAYYMAEAAAFCEGGHITESSGQHSLVLEGWKSDERLLKEWQEVQSATKKFNRPGDFVTFPGYEWQGDGSSGDHNVFYLQEGEDICRVNTVAELYKMLQGKDVIAIPHHTAYRPGLRGRDWSVFDEKLSPFAEIFSIHGCSETDEECCGMRSNSHLGPSVGAGTYQSALNRGYHLGAICSTDNWGEMPGCYGNGRMACIAHELSRESLWEAFVSRRVYGVTGDRIELDFTVNTAPMGSIITSDGRRTIRVNVVGSDEIDRIELLRNGRVIATHCHQGSWRMPTPGKRSRFKMRIEAGWGPRPNELKVSDRKWDGILAVAGAKMKGYEPCWISPGQSAPELSGDTAEFKLLTNTANLNHRWQNSNIFEFEADIAAELKVELNGQVETGILADFTDCSREMWFKEECIALLDKVAGIAPGSPEREDIYHHVAFKAKLHRAMPESAYTASLEIEDDEPFDGEINYRVRIQQRNGERAWSSPIWVNKDA